MTKKVKAIFLGDSGVGKSCIISAVCGLPINNIHKVNHKIKLAHSRHGFLDKNIQLWDTAGQ